MKNNNFARAKVVYEDIDNQNQQIYSRNISGKINNFVDLNYYKHYIPSGYKFEGYGNFNHHLKDHDVDVIYIRKDHNNLKQGRIMVDYIDSNSQLIHHSAFTDNIGNTFGSDQYKSAVPKHYKFNRILTGNNITSFKSDPQIMIIQVAKIIYAKITIKYLCNGQLVDKDSTTGALGTNFNINPYTTNIPSGYTFSKIDGKIPNTFQHNQSIGIDVIDNNSQNNKPTNKSNRTSNSKDADVGKILMKLADSLHTLGLTISKNHKS